MRSPHARFKLPGGREVIAGPGSIVGRLETAAVLIPHPAISEAHALISLRGRSLHLVALRGSLWVDGLAEDDLVLEVGQLVGLAETVTLEVVDVVVPLVVPAVITGDGSPRELCAALYSLIEVPSPEWVPRYEPGALARIWSTAEGWATDVGGRARRLRTGDHLEVGEHRVRCVEVAVDVAGTAPTTDRRSPIAILARHPLVHLQRPGRDTVVIEGVLARVIEELGGFAVPVEWGLLAGQLWPDEPDRMVLRRRWDRVAARLRARLRETGLREDLVRSDRQGNVELFLQAGDRYTDEG